VIDIGDGRPSSSRWRATTTRAISSPIRARDRCRRHPARRLHHGRAPDRLFERAALRRAGHPKTRHLVGRRRRRRRLRQFVRRAHGGRRDVVSTPAMTATSSSTRWRCRSRRCRQDLPIRAASGVGLADRLSRLQDRAATASAARRWPRPNSTRIRGEAPDRAGRRSLHREVLLEACLEMMADRLRHRDPGHGRCRPHLLGRRDGRQGRPRHRARLDAVPTREEGMTATR
jgi:hypothetical protein